MMSDSWLIKWRKAFVNALQDSENLPMVKAEEVDIKILARNEQASNNGLLLSQEAMKSDQNASFWTATLFAQPACTWYREMLPSQCPAVNIVQKNGQWFSYFGVKIQREKILDSTICDVVTHAFSAKHRRSKSWACRAARTAASDEQSFQGKRDEIKFLE